MLNKKPILDTHRAHNLQFILVLVLAATMVIMGLFLYSIVNDANFSKTTEETTIIKPETTGKVFDYRKSEVLNNYSSSSFMPDGWSFVTFQPTESNNLENAWGLWVLNTEPSVGSRELSEGSVGDDVASIKSAMNNLQPLDTNDEFYFEKLPANGTYDSKTSEVVQKLRKYFFLDDGTGADLTFQYKVYKQLVEPPVN